MSSHTLSGQKETVVLTLPLSRTLLTPLGLGKTATMVVLARVERKSTLKAIVITHVAPPGATTFGVGTSF